MKGSVNVPSRSWSLGSQQHAGKERKGENFVLVSSALGDRQGSSVSRAACGMPCVPDSLQAISGNDLRVKTQRVKTSENFSEESNLPRRFRRYPEILQNPVKVISEKSSEMSSANIFFFREVLRSFYPLRFYPLGLSDIWLIIL